MWFWLGGSDEEVEGIWRWYNDHSVFNYTNWHIGQPDSKRSDDCLALWGPNNFTGWDDYYCDYKSHYVCEKRYAISSNQSKSKKISNDQELIQSDPISCPQNQKGNN